MSVEAFIEAAMTNLPHRAPFRFVSSLRVLEPSVRGEGFWSVTGAEDFFAGHFPDEPIIPGVLLAEALAQLAGMVWAGADSVPARAVRLARVDVKFHTPIRPPATVDLTVVLARALDGTALFEVAANVGGSPAATGQVVLARSGG